MDPNDNSAVQAGPQRSDHHWTDLNQRPFFPPNALLISVSFYILILLLPGDFFFSLFPPLS